MRIKLLPIFSQAQLVVSRAGEALVINGQRFDFSGVTEGATLPGNAIASSVVFGLVERAEGMLTITMLLPHNADAPEHVRSPADIVEPADGPVAIPGQPQRGEDQLVDGVIDWSRLVTAQMKADAAAAQLLAQALHEVTELRTIADFAIAPLQDAVDLDEATEAEAALLKEWKRYRVALNRLPEQPGYPAEIDWPAPPA